MRLAALLFVAAVAACAQTQPAVGNAQFTTQPFSGDLAREMRTAGPEWFGYAVQAPERVHESCCGDGWQSCTCALEGGGTGSSRTVNSSGPVKLEGSNDWVAVLFRVANDRVEKIRIVPLTCALDAGGLRFVWITNVSAHASLSYLEALVESGSSQQVENAAVFAISQHADPEAVQLLIHDAKTDASAQVRGQALFWLAQRAGERAIAALGDAIVNDPDMKVKKQAVFALSQVPNGEGVPKLIEVARTQRDPPVRKQAFFWLGQSHDPRALAFFEQVLTK